MSWFFPSSQRPPLSRTGSKIGIRRYKDGSREFYRESPRLRRDSGYEEMPVMSEEPSYHDHRTPSSETASVCSPSCDLTREEDFREALDAFTKLAHLSELPRTQSDTLVVMFSKRMMELDRSNERQMSAVSRHFTNVLARADNLNLPDDIPNIEELLRSMLDILS
jgi:hypothetical protein